MTTTNNTTPTADHYQMIRDGVPEGMWLDHTVLFNFEQSEATEAQIEELMAECRDMGDACGGKEAGIMSCMVERNIDMRPGKGWSWGEKMEFSSAEAFIRFHQHPAHDAFRQRMVDCKGAVWAVFDVAVPPRN